jgi:hypothetical protein
MSPVLHSRLVRPSALGLREKATAPIGVRREADAILRDLAFVLHLTEEVKAALLRSRSEKVGKASPV